MDRSVLVQAIQRADQILFQNRLDQIIGGAEAEAFICLFHDRADNDRKIASIGV
jgi:hypothetical protein